MYRRTLMVIAALFCCGCLGEAQGQTWPELIEKLDQACRREAPEWAVNRIYELGDDARVIEWKSGESSVSVVIFMFPSEEEAAEDHTAFISNRPQKLIGDGSIIKLYGFGKECHFISGYVNERALAAMKKDKVFVIVNGDDESSVIKFARLMADHLPAT